MNKLGILFLLVFIFPFSPASLMADSVVIPYSIKLDDDFLLGMDSVEIILHNGKFIKQFKIVKGKDMSVEMTHFIPCFSGRSLSLKEKVSEIINYNGRSYNFYYPHSNRMISVRNITAYAERHFSIEKNSFHHVDMIEVENSFRDISSFNELYLSFVKMKAMLKVKGLDSISVHPYYSSRASSLCLRKIRFDHYTVSEFNAMFKTNIEGDGIIDFGIVKVSIEGGIIQSVEY